MFSTCLPLQTVNPRKAGTAVRSPAAGKVSDHRPQQPRSSASTLALGQDLLPSRGLFPTGDQGQLGTQAIPARRGAPPTGDFKGSLFTWPKLSQKRAAARDSCYPDSFLPSLLHKLIGRLSPPFFLSFSPLLFPLSS